METYKLRIDCNEEDVETAKDIVLRQYAMKLGGVKVFPRWRIMDSSANSTLYVASVIWNEKCMRLYADQLCNRLQEKLQHRYDLECFKAVLRNENVEPWNDSKEECEFLS